MLQLQTSVNMSTRRKCPDSPVSTAPSELKNCHVLSLAEKVEVINAVDAGLNKRKAALKFSCGCTQILNIVNNKQEILETFANGCNSDSKLIKQCAMVYSDVDTECWEFFCDACSKNMALTGALLKSEDLDIAARHGYEDLTASNGWMQSFIARHQIKFSNLHGESAGMNPQVCSQWMQQLPTMCEGYDLKDIWNVDETGIFFRSV